MKVLNPKIFFFEWFPFLTKGILFSRISWSIRMRWLAVSGYFLATLVSHYLLHLDIPYEKVWTALLVLALINLIYYAVMKWIKEFTFTRELIFLQTHIFIDTLYNYRHYILFLKYLTRINRKKQITNYN